MVNYWMKTYSIGTRTYEVNHRVKASPINRSEVKKRLLEQAALTRHHKFSRVSRHTLNVIELRVENIINEVVRSTPSRGMTL